MTTERTFTSVASVAFRKKVRDAFREAGFKSPMFYNKRANGYAYKYSGKCIRGADANRSYDQGLIKWIAVADSLGLKYNLHSTFGPMVYVPNQDTYLP